MDQKSKIAFVFPGQGAQYPGMGKDFFNTYSEARQTFEEAEDILGRKLTSLVFDGPEDVLTQTGNSQVAIYVVSLAILRVIAKLFPSIVPAVTAGLSLGEYTALTASGRLAMAQCLPLVQHRALFMNEACELTKGTMAVIIGLEGSVVEDMVREVNLPQDLWAANFNCPGQVVISGTLKGIEAGSAAAKNKGAKRVLPLQVHGAFHSGLMKSAEEKLSPFIQNENFKDSLIKLVMNVSGDFVQNAEMMRKYLIKQVTNPVRWEQGVRAIAREGVDLFLEMGCGKTLAGLHKRIGVTAPIVSIEKIEELVQIEQILS